MFIFIVLFFVLLYTTASYMHNTNYKRVHVQLPFFSGLHFTITSWKHTSSTHDTPNAFIRIDDTYSYSTIDGLHFALWGTEILPEDNHFASYNKTSASYISACLGLEHTDIYNHQNGIQTYTVEEIERDRELDTIMHDDFIPQDVGQYHGDDEQEFID